MNTREIMIDHLTPKAYGFFCPACNKRLSNTVVKINRFLPAAEKKKILEVYKEGGHCRECGGIVGGILKEILED